MNSKRSLGIAAAALALLGGLWIAQASPAPSPAPLAVAAKLSPCADGSFALDAEIRDIASGETLVRPALRFADGSRASVKSEIPGRAPLVLTVTADSRRGTAAVELAEMDGSRNLTVSRFDLRLR